MSLSRSISIILTVGLFLSSCKESVRMVDCVAIENGLSVIEETRQASPVLHEINKLCVDLKPQVTENDEFGHEINFNTLIERMNDNCDLFIVELVTYATIKTNPVQSEINITLIDNNESYIINVSTPEDDILKAVSIHK